MIHTNEHITALHNCHGMNYKSIFHFILKNLNRMQVLESDIIISITLNLFHIMKMINQSNFTS